MQNWAACVSAAIVCASSTLWFLTHPSICEWIVLHLGPMINFSMLLTNLRVDILYYITGLIVALGYTDFFQTFVTFQQPDKTNKDRKKTWWWMTCHERHHLNPNKRLIYILSVLGQWLCLMMCYLSELFCWRTGKWRLFIHLAHWHIFEPLKLWTSGINELCNPNSQ